MSYLQYSPTAINGLYYTQLDDKVRIGIPMELMREFDSQFRAVLPKDRKQVALRWYNWLSKDQQKKVALEGLPTFQEDEFYPDITSDY